MGTKSGDSLDSEYPNITGPSDYCVSQSTEVIGVTTLTVVSEVMCSEDPWWQLISPVSLLSGDEESLVFGEG